MRVETLKAAVVGCGGWGRHHVEAYWRNPTVELVAVCGSRNRERTERVAAQYGAHAYLDIAEMLERERPGVVSVITPDGAHYAPYKAVLETAVHCFLEKPLCLNLEEGRELVALARSQPRKCGINFNHRFTTPFRLAAECLRDGRAGRPLCLHWRFTGGHYPEGQTLPMAHLLYMQSHGWNIMQAFGGAIRSIAGHAFDPRGAGQHTTATFSLEFESGAVGTFVASVDGDYKDPDIYQFELMGDQGRIVVDDAVRRFEFCPRGAVDPDGSLARVWNSHFFDDDSRSFARTTDRHLDAFLRAVREDTPEPVPVEEGLAALEAGLAAIRAAQTGERQAV